MAIIWIYGSCYVLSDSNVNGLGLHGNLPISPSEQRPLQATSQEKAGLTSPRDQISVEPHLNFKASEVQSVLGGPTTDSGYESLRKGPLKASWLTNTEIVSVMSDNRDQNWTKRRQEQACSFFLKCFVPEHRMFLSTVQPRKVAAWKYFRCPKNVRRQDCVRSRIRGAADDRYTSWPTTKVYYVWWTIIVGSVVRMAGI